MRGDYTFVKVLMEALREKMCKLGYVERRNIAYEFRWADGRQERVKELAEELVRLQVDVMVTQTTFVAAAAKRATATIPIVMASTQDPVSESRQGARADHSAGGADTRG